MIDNYYAYYIKLCFVDINKIKNLLKFPLTTYIHTHTHKKKIEILFRIIIY